MDSSHVALVSLKLEIGLFETYRCDRTLNLGLSLKHVANALKCANATDSCLIKYEDDADQVIFTFIDSKREKTSVSLHLQSHSVFPLVQDVTVKLMDIDHEHLGIPDQEYSVNIEMSSEEFKKTCANLTLFSDAMNITATKGNIVFTGKGDSGSTVIAYSPGGADADDEEGNGKNGKKVISPHFVSHSQRRLGVILQSIPTVIEVNEAVNVNFSIKYMNNFTKATPLCEKVPILCPLVDLSL